MNDSKDYWLKLNGEIDFKTVTLGDYSSYDYLNDPKRLVFMGARYKFCSKLLEGFQTVLEVGCGDGFGSAIVADAVEKLICTDINEKLLESNSERNAFLKNVKYEYFDFRKSPYPEKVDGLYLVDVLEHFFPEEEPAIMQNLSASLAITGVAILGTPNKTAKKFASENANKQHVNLKDATELRSLCNKYFQTVFMFGMNDEVVHTGFLPMAHYLWALCVNPKNGAMP